MLAYIKWIYACMILHNMLADLGNTWDEIHANIEELDHEPLPQGQTHPSENMHTLVKKKCPVHFGFKF